MNKCECKRGVFTLVDCPNESVKVCSTCSRNICEEHISESDTVCTDCFVGKDDEKSERMKRLQKGGSINYLGEAGLGQYYSAYDIKSFDVKTDGFGIDATEEEMDFLDS